MTIRNRSSVILADDDEHFLGITAHHLSQWGFRVEKASSKTRLLQLLSHQEPDLLLMDVRFGDHDGLEILEQLKRGRPKLPILLLTAHGDREAAEDAIRLGASDYIAKPIDLGRLRISMNQALDNPDVPIITAPSASEAPGPQETVATSPVHSLAIDDPPSDDSESGLSAEERLEKQELVQTLRRFSGSVPETAKWLKIGQAMVYRKIKRYQIRVEAGGVASN